MDCDHIVFSGHALQRMFERRISANDVKNVLRQGEAIADYPDDTPFPSSVMLGFIESRAIHVVVAVERQTGACYVITAYPPDPDLWDSDFRRRRS